MAHLFVLWGTQNNSRRERNEQTEDRALLTQYGIFLLKMRLLWHYMQFFWNCMQFFWQNPLLRQKSPIYCVKRAPNKIPYVTEDEALVTYMQFFWHYMQFFWWPISSYCEAPKTTADGSAMSRQKIGLFWRNIVLFWHHMQFSWWPICLYCEAPKTTADGSAMRRQKISFVDAIWDSFDTTWGSFGRIWSSFDGILICVSRDPQQWQTGRKWARCATVTQKSPILRQKSPTLRQKSPICVKRALYCFKRVPFVWQKWMNGQRWAQYATVTQKSPIFRQRVLFVSKEPYIASKEYHVCQNSPMLRQKSPNRVKTMADGTEMSKMRDGNSKEPYIASKESYSSQKSPILRQKSIMCVKEPYIASKESQSCQNNGRRDGNEQDARR